MTVIDAKTMSAEPVAVVELPHRVPYGFHALFVTEVPNSTTHIFLYYERCISNHQWVWYSQEQLQEQTLI